MRWASILVSVLLGGCCFTDVGCAHMIVVNGIDDPFDSAEICFDGQCGVFAADGSAPTGDASCNVILYDAAIELSMCPPEAIQPGAILEVRLYEDGAMTAERELVIESYREIRPNGELCDPVCRSTTLDW